MQDIDMQTYTGDLEPAAGVQDQVSNSYLHEQQGEEFLLQNTDTPPDEVAQPSKQELNFRALTQEVDKIKQERDIERKALQEQIDMLRANAAPQVHEPVRQRRMFEDMKDDDIPNVSELRHEWEAREQQYQQRIEEMEVAHSNPDYFEVMDRYTKPLLQQKPHLVQGILGAQNKALFAYELGKMAQQIHSTPPAQTQTSPAAQRIVENARKPGTLAQAGGQSVLSKADYYATMSDQEFMRIAGRNLEQI